MNFLNRLYYFSTGLVIGVVFLLFILNGKRASCNYGPNARVIDNITSKDIILIDTINNMSLDECKKLYEHMLPTLEHNYHLAKQLMNPNLE